LRFATATAAYGITPRFMFGSEDKRSTISLGFNNQNLNDVLADEDTGNNIANNVVSLGYSLALRQSGTSLNLSLIGNRNQIKEIERYRIGANIGFTKAFSDKKFSLNLGVGGFQNYLDGDVEGYSITGRLGTQYKLKNSMNIGGFFNFINRTGEAGYREIRGNIRFSYRIPKVSSSKKQNNSLQNQ
jgi:hypothetical protein